MRQTQSKIILFILALTVCLGAFSLPALAADTVLEAQAEAVAEAWEEPVASAGAATASEAEAETEDIPADEAGDGFAYPESLVIRQSRGGTCTLCSAAMMLRARLYRDGSSDWQAPDESSTANYGWCSEGLIWSWSYPAGDETLTVAHAFLSGVSEGELAALLDEHPEGIVLYCGHLPHAVFLMGYEDGTFTCADPAWGTVSSLAESSLGSYGGQDSILANVTAYWYIDN